MNSQTQTKPTDIKAECIMPASDVCAIIESCGKAGVRVLKLGNLYLALGAAPQKEVAYPIMNVPVIPAGPDHEKQNAEALLKDEDELRAEQLALLAIEDPMEYERQLRDGELEDEPGESDISE